MMPDPFALASFQQVELWTATQISADQAGYNLLRLLHLRGPLDEIALATAISRIITRHDGLRAVFELTAAGLRQRFLPVETVIVGELETHECRPEDLENVARAFGRMPFALEQGPLFRFRLVHLPSDHHVLLCGFHHLIIDGTSWRMFIEELMKHLAGDTLPPLSAACAEYGTWQAEQVASGCWNRSRDYWRGVYHQAPAPKDIPSDRARPRIPDLSMGVHAFNMPPETASRLRAAASRYGTSPFRVAFAGFLAFVHRLTGQPDLLAATTLIGRSDPRFAGLIGFFVNNGGIRVQVGGSTTFCDLVSAVRAGFVAAVEHQDYPYDLAIRDAAPRRERGRDPFSTVGFTKMPALRIRHAAGLEVWEERIFLGQYGHDISVYMQDAPDRIRFEWIYRATLFDASTIERFADQFLRVLHRLLEEPEAAVSQLNVISTAERRRILVEWNDNDIGWSGPRTVHSMVEEQVERTPEHIAIVGETLQMTYREVNAAANRLAQQLQARGIGPGDFVPLLLDVSPALLVAELAVMKTGAAFAPLDPGWPPQRILALVDRLRARVSIIRSSIAADFASQNLDYLTIDLASAATPEANLGVQVGAEQPIYCLFTSGSTGEPKGAVNLHGGIVNRLSTMCWMFDPAAAEAVLVTSPPTFDSSVWQLFWPLVCGGRSVILPTEQTTNPLIFPGLMKRHGITIMDSVPSLFQPLVRHLKKDAGARGGFEKLRRIMIGGEAMAADPVYEFKAMFPHVAITNSYGPTETSIGVIFHEVPDSYSNPVPIGRPIPNVRAVILDPNLQLVPVGTAGELCLGGVCVGAGYLHDAESTAAVFVPNPFPELRCPILYRTGDLAKFRADGVIEYLGRKDQQVKIRGVRIEPGEIEACLERQPGVRQAAVVARNGAHGTTQLAAYLVPADPGTAPDASALRDSLEEHLPAAMIPSVFLLVDSLPLTTSGKVDRKTLAGVPGRALESARMFEPPSNDAERHIATIWQELLGVQRVGIHDHFFELGGDSLLALRFVTLFAERAGQRAEVRWLFESPTPARLSRRLAQAQTAPEDQPHADTTSSLLAKQRSLVSTWNGRQAALDSFVFTLNESGRQRGLFWCFQGYRELEQMASSLGPDQPVHGMRSGHLIMEYTEENISVLADHYAAEINKLQPAGSIVLGGNCQGAVIARATALSLERAGRKIALLVLMEESTFRPYAGHVALLFSRESSLNPYRPGADPEVIFRRAYAGGFSVHWMTGRHGEFFGEDNICSLGETLRPLLASAQGSE